MMSDNRKKEAASERSVLLLRQLAVLAVFCVVVVRGVCVR
jgi:hypothetical protein